LLSCKSRPWGRIVAKAVNKITRVDAESGALLAEMAREDALQLCHVLFSTNRSRG